VSEFKDKGYIMCRDVFSESARSARSSRSSPATNSHSNLWPLESYLVPWSLQFSTAPAIVSLLPVRF